MFGDDYPRFIELSELSEPQQRPDLRTSDEQRIRMNERYEALFASNRDVFEGARVLDLASHDGRYSFAALKTGAAHVIGVEARKELIDKAQEAFAHYGQDPRTYRFVQGDLFEVLARERFEVDVVLCFGFLYHTYRHTELMYRLHQLAPEHLIMDTMVTHQEQPTLKMIREKDTGDIRSAIQDPWSVGRVLVLRPSRPALELLLDSYGFEVESAYDWAARLADRPAVPGLAVYAHGGRVSWRCRFRGSPIARASSTTQHLTQTHEEPVVPPPSPTPVAATRPARSWRRQLNRTLARATGYQLQRVYTRR